MRDDNIFILTVIIYGGIWNAHLRRGGLRERDITIL